MANVEKLKAEALGLESAIVTLETQRRVLRDEMRILEREVFELHHLRTQSGSTCPFCKRSLTPKVLDSLIVEREEELERIIEALDEVRGRHGELEVRLSAVSGRVEGGKGCGKGSAPRKSGRKPGGRGGKRA